MASSRQLAGWPSEEEEQHAVASGKEGVNCAGFELADGLFETLDHQLRVGLDPDSAAAAAVAEFGSVDQITAAFTRHAPGRRAALALLATGPAVGGCWGASLITAQARTWPLATGVAIAFGATLLAIVAVLITVTANTTDYTHTRLTAVGGTGVILLDTAMLITVAAAAPVLVWPMALAIPASLVRIGLTLRALPRILAS